MIWNFCSDNSFVFCWNYSSEMIKIFMNTKNRKVMIDKLTIRMFLEIWYMKIKFLMFTENVFLVGLSVSDQFALKIFK